MHTVVRAWAMGLALAAALPAHAAPREMGACTGPDDPVPCLLENAGPDRSRLPASGLGAWAGGDRLVISWVGEADEVEVTGSILLPAPCARWRRTCTS